MSMSWRSIYQKDVFELLPHEGIAVLGETRLVLQLDATSWWRTRIVLLRRWSKGHPTLFEAVPCQLKPIARMFRCLRYVMSVKRGKWRLNMSREASDQSSSSRWLLTQRRAWWRIMVMYAKLRQDVRADCMVNVGAHIIRYTIILLSTRRKRRNRVMCDARGCTLANGRLGTDWDDSITGARAHVDVYVRYVVL